jgi:hypothetical protein
VGCSDEQTLVEQQLHGCCAVIGKQGMVACRVGCLAAVTGSQSSWHDSVCSSACIYLTACRTPYNLLLPHIFTPYPPAERNARRHRQGPRRPPPQDQRQRAHRRISNSAGQYPHRRGRADRCRQLGAQASGATHHGGRVTSQASGHSHRWVVAPLMMYYQTHFN